MAKTIIIDTEVRGVEEAVEDINKVDSEINKVNENKIKIGFDAEKTEKELKKIQETGDKISKLGEGIAGGFLLANSAVATFGESIGFSNEEVQEAQEKAAAFLGIMQSLKPVTEGVSVAFDLLGKILKVNPLILIGTIIAGVLASFLDFEKIIEGVKTAFVAVGEAAKAVWNGIVDGVMYAIDLYTQYLDLITFGLFDINDAYKGYVKNIEDANEAERRRIEALKEEEKQIKKNIDALGSQISAVRKAEQAAAERQKAVEKAYDIEIRLANAAGKNTEELEAKKLEDVKRSIEERIKLKIKEFETDQKIIEEQLKLTENYNQQQSKVEALANKSSIEGIKKKSKDTKKFIKELQDDLLETETRIEEERLTKEKENYDKWKQIQEEKTKKAQEEAEKRAEFEKKVLDDLQTVQAKSSDEIYNEYLMSQQKSTGSFFDVIAQTQKELAEKNSETAQAELDRIKEINELRVNAVSDTLDILSSLNDIFASSNEKNAERAFKIQKAINIAQAIIDTYRGATSALATGSAINPAYGFISAAAVVAAGLANVAKIAQTQYNGGSSSGAGSGQGISASAPALPTVDTSSTPFQFPTAPNGQPNQPRGGNMFVSVVEINDTQRRVNLAEANSTF